MTKSELIEQVSELLKLPSGKAEQIVNCVFDSMVKALQEGDGIEIRGFGSFTVREYKAYEGRNPRTGETVHVAPKRLPFFKVGKDLRERVNRSIQSGNGADLDDDDDDDELDTARGGGQPGAARMGWNGGERSSEPAAGHAAPGRPATGELQGYAHSSGHDSSDHG